jgi:hypothetical protein
VEMVSGHKVDRTAAAVVHKQAVPGHMGYAVGRVVAVHTAVVPVATNVAVHCQLL